MKNRKANGEQSTLLLSLLPPTPMGHKVRSPSPAKGSRHRPNIKTRSNRKMNKHWSRNWSNLWHKLDQLRVYPSSFGVANFTKYHSQNRQLKETKLLRFAPEVDLYQLVLFFFFFWRLTMNRSTLVRWIGWQQCTTMGDTRVAGFCCWIVHFWLL